MNETKKSLFAQCAVCKEDLPSDVMIVNWTGVPVCDACARSIAKIYVGRSKLDR